jgi:hypothetical protein
MNKDDGRFVLFKFKKINEYLLSCIVNNSLYFAKPEELNDPFDCQIDLPTLINSIRPSLDRGRQKLVDSLQGIDGLRRHVSGCGVFSASRCNSDPRMWAHYADDHKGLCLTY